MKFLDPPVKFATIGKLVAALVGNRGGTSLPVTNRSLESVPTSESAREIVERLLAQTGKAIMTDDFSLARPCFKLPQDIQIFDNGVNIETVEDLRALFEGVRDYYASLGVTEVVRPCNQVAFHDEDTIYANHMTYLMSGGVMLVEPYPVFSIIRRDNGVWKIAHALYATTKDMDAPDWAYRYLRSSDE